MLKRVRLSYLYNHGHYESALIIAKKLEESGRREFSAIRYYCENVVNKNKESKLKKYNFEFKKGSKIRCKYCGKYVYFVHPDDSYAYLGGNNCHWCKRGYPMPSYKWDIFDGLSYSYERGSVWDDDFYKMFEKLYPEYPHSEASDLCLKRHRDKWVEFASPEEQEKIVQKVYKEQHSAKKSKLKKG